MKSFSKQVLMLGGFCFIISLCFSFISNMIGEIANMALLLVFVVMLLILCFKKEYKFISSFQNKFPKTSNFIEAFGYPEYFGIIFLMIPGIIYGYKAGMARYNGSEMPIAPVAYLHYCNYIYVAILCLSVIWAIYKSFIKK